MTIPSYLLVGFYQEHKAARAASTKYLIQTLTLGSCPAGDGVVICANYQSRNERICELLVSQKKK